MSGLEAVQKNDSPKLAAEHEQPALPNLVDLHKDLAHVSKNKLVAVAENPIAMNAYLNHRDEEESQNSYFKNGVSFVTRLGRQAFGINDASSKFDQARKNGEQALMMSLAEDDHKQRHWEESAGNYSSLALKTGFLFTQGKVGLGGLVAVSATDAAKPADPFPRQAVDTILGSAKGIATFALFSKINEQSWNPVVKGWSFGVGERFIDNGLSSKYYFNKEGGITGESFKNGLVTTLHHSFGPEALGTDAAALGASALLIPINNYTGGAFFKNPFASKLVIAGVSGLVDGSHSELNHQQDHNKKPIDWLEVAKKGGEKSILDTITAIPGTRLWY